MSDESAYEVVRQHLRYHQRSQDESRPICIFERGKRQWRLDNGEAEHPCFHPGERSQGNCQGDGWYHCRECADLDPDSLMLQDME
jgi:hypothetical protein